MAAKKIQIAKYHGCGNDFVLVRKQDVIEYEGGFGPFATEICDRRTGIGADGLILVGTEPPEMDIYNSDGSRAPMCGNGIRCFAHYCREEGLIPEAHYTVGTLAGSMAVRVVSAEPFRVEIGLGRARTASGDMVADSAGADGAIGFGAAGRGMAGGATGSSIVAGAANADDIAGFGAAGMDDVIVRRVWAEIPDGTRKTPRRVETRSLFLGTLHTVLWLGDGASAGMEGLLPKGMSLMDLARDSAAFRLAEVLSAHAVFPEQVNVNLAKVLDSRRVELITWERGAGLTDACGTGAAATVWVAYQEGRLKKESKVLLRRGALDIRIEDTGQVFMTGPSVRIMKGSYYGSAGNHPVHQ